MKMWIKRIFCLTIPEDEIAFGIKPYVLSIRKMSYHEALRFNNQFRMWGIDLRWKSEVSLTLGYITDHETTLKLSCVNQLLDYIEDRISGFHQFDPC